MATVVQFVTPSHQVMPLQPVGGQAGVHQDSRQAGKRLMQGACGTTAGSPGDDGKGAEVCGVGGWVQSRERVRPPRAKACKLGCALHAQAAVAFPV